MTRQPDPKEPDVLFPCIDQIEIKGKRLLIRVDYNVPLKDGVIGDDNRIRSGLETVRYALKNGASAIVCSHLGSPDGKPVPKMSLGPVAQRMSELLGQKVELAPDCVGPEVRRMAARLKPGQALLLENLRFHPEEQGKKPEQRGDFGKQLAELADIYVNDAFAVAHRNNASVVDAPKWSKKCCIGFLLKEEWEYLGENLAHPKRPYVAISGGSKVSTKLGIIRSLLPQVDDFIIGGAMANTFLLAQGHGVGRSLVEPDLVDTALEILHTAEEHKAKVHLPVDFVVGRGAEDKEPLGVFDADSIPAEGMMLDIGPKSVALFSAVLRPAATVIWNGPMGLFENSAFASGSLALCRAVADLEALTIVGGGDTVAVLHQTDLSSKFTFISTAGGAFLEFLEGRELPAFKALKECLNK
ncbi:MAG: phosphoglycerate kinase [Desulfovibrionaceae bacterium]|nr:phosphoglycerate kinase [Desulfovibrionaceae bacterium]